MTIALEGDVARAIFGLLTDHFAEKRVDVATTKRVKLVLRAYTYHSDVPVRMLFKKMACGPVATKAKRRSILHRSIAAKDFMGASSKDFYCPNHERNAKKSRSI